MHDSVGNGVNSQGQMKGRISVNACAATDNPLESTDNAPFTHPRITNGSTASSFLVCFGLTRTSKPSNTLRR